MSTMELNKSQKNSHRPDNRLKVIRLCPKTRHNVTFHGRKFAAGVSLYNICIFNMIEELWQPALGSPYGQYVRTGGAYEFISILVENWGTVGR
jgi:hypothetical protein